MTKFLIVGLGNIGDEYTNTRHNIGFDVINHIAAAFEVEMTTYKMAEKGNFNFSGKKITLLKPSTFVNRSGKAVRYWALKENIALQNILVITDDLHLPHSALRLKGQGSDGGHNGLKDIEAQLNTPRYSRLRFGIQNDKQTLNQVDFVLGKFSKEEQNLVDKSLPKCQEIVLSFVKMGLEKTMNTFNGIPPKGLS
ncbi:MAG: aminoacyl-tRNA hydrolase [Flavobacteriaceae bacterium]|nr:aminoacyl-tRNA hydrolase [Flavobacteriaceae bacterium]